MSLISIIKGSNTYVSSTANLGCYMEGGKGVVYSVNSVSLSFLFV